MKRRILMVLEAGDAYPSGVVRALLYRDFLQKQGYDVRYVSRQCVPLIRFLFYPPRWIVPFLSRAVTGALYRLADVIAYIKEGAIVRQAKDVDVVYACKVTSLRLISELRQKTQARLVLDFGDALWLPAARVPKLDDVLKSVDAVTTDNEFTAAYVRPLNGHCVVVPDSPQVELFDRTRSSRGQKKDPTVTIGWIGTPSSINNLFLIWEALEKLFSRHTNVQLRLVGTGADSRLLPPFEKVKAAIVPRYDQSTMVREILGMDIGLFPLYDVEASRARGILKATVYMAGEAAVAASPVGQVAELIQDGVNGVLPRSGQEWETKLEKLILDAPYRRKIASAGLETVRRDFTLEKSFLTLHSVLCPPQQP